MRFLHKHGISARRLAAGLTVALLTTVHPAHAEDWLPIDPDELKMTAEPKAPGAAAIYLYRQVDRNDESGYEIVYNRVKILTAEGRDYGNVQIEYEKNRETISGIAARTIEPDGRIVNFTGSVFDKPVVEARQGKIMQKTLTLPELKPGCIIEYRYRRNLPGFLIYNSQWLLSEALFTRSAKFSLTAYPGFSLRTSWPAGLPEGTDRPSKRNGQFRLETHDVPAFVTEEHMPPANELKMRVDFIYTSEQFVETDPDKFWADVGKRQFKKVDRFVDENKAMQSALSGIVTAGDSSDVKLQKIYERVIQLRNTTAERQKTQQETDRANEKEAHDVAEVWKRGYGDATELTWLFLGLVRAAGLQADPVLVPTRDKYFFNRKLMAEPQLNSNLVAVVVEGKTQFLDPGLPWTPFGMLPWYESGVEGLKLDKKGGTWIEIPMSDSAESQVKRTADLKLDRSGTLEGKLTITYTGLEASWRRGEERNEDATDRKEFLEEEIRRSIPSGIEIKLIEEPEWIGASPSMTAIFDLRIPGWAQMAGHRALLTTGIFGEPERHSFEHSIREHPIYFDYPFQTADEVNIELPNGWQAAAPPQPRQEKSPVTRYTMVIEDQGASIRIKRDFGIGFIILPTKYYASLRKFYDSVRSGDQEQIVITSAAKATAKN